MAKQQPAERAEEPTDGQLLAAQEAVNYAIAHTGYRQPPAETEPDSPAKEV